MTIQNLTLLWMVALVAPAARAACDLARVQVTGKTVQQCMAAAGALTDGLKQPCAWNQEWAHTVSDKLVACTKAAMDNALDRRLLRLKKADPPQFRREMKMQASFNSGESAVCSSRRALSPREGWAQESVCRIAHRALRVELDEAVEKGKLSLPDLALKGQASAEHRAFAEALCAMPATVFEGGVVPERCVERVLGLMEMRFEGISVTEPPKASAESADAEVQGEMAIDPRKWVESLCSDDEKERAKALADPVLGKWVIAGSGEGSDSGCEAGFIELNLEKESKTEILVEIPGDTQRLVLLQPIAGKRWRVIWSAESTVSPMMCDVANPYSVSADHLTSADHETLKLSVRSGSITSPAAGGGCNYNVHDSWFDLHGSHLTYVVGCLECTIVPEGPFPRKVLGSLGDLYAPDESGTYQQIAGRKL